MGKPGKKPLNRAGKKPGTRICAWCKSELPLTNFYKDARRPDGLYPECKECVRGKRRAHYLRSKNEVLDSQRKYTRGIRKKVLDHYGHKCACCGESRYEFLAIDHVEGGGMRHRLEIGYRSKSLAGWLVKNNFPPGFRLLCHNCNFSKGHYGYCPHDGNNARLPVTAASVAPAVNGAELVVARWDGASYKPR